MPLFRVDQYLAIERAAPERHEFLDGQIVALAGESGAHADICANLVGLLVAQLKGTPCRARTKDTKVRSGPAPVGRASSSGLYAYPDIVIICGTPEYHDDYRDVVLNPTAIFEVLSPATEAFDRGEKFARYQTWNPTLQDYVLVCQDAPQLEQFSRQPDGSWSYQRHSGRAARLAIPAIRCTLPLTDIYDRLVFPQAPTALV